MGSYDTLSHHLQIDNWIHQIKNDTNTVYIKAIRSASNSMYDQQSIYSSTIFNGSLYLYKDSKKTTIMFDKP